MHSTLAEKQALIIKEFSQFKTTDEKYQKLIDLGRQQSPLEEKYKTAENIVKGCQSTMYLHSCIENGLMIFQAESDALISAGLAALLINVYNGETPQTVLTSSPTYLEELGIQGALSPNRANGLYSIHLRMKQDALKFFMQNPA